DRNFRSDPPIAETMKIPRSSRALVRANAISLPSGDHAGPGGEAAALCVKRSRVSLPSVFTSRYQLKSNSSPAAQEYATRVPSGEKAGSHCPPSPYVTIGTGESFRSIGPAASGELGLRRTATIVPSTK